MWTKARPLKAAVPILLAWWPLACNGAKTPVAGSTVEGPVGVRADGNSFLVDINFGGLSQGVRLTRLYWGRLVDVFGLDADGEPVLMQPNFVIGGGLVDESGRWDLGANSVTGSETLIILRDVTDPVQRAEFFDLLVQSEANVTPVFDNGLGGAGLFSMVPRNAVLVLSLNDLYDPSTATGETIRVRTGAPAVEPFEVRVLVDENHGDLTDFDGDGELEFYPTRLIVDPTISEFEAFSQDPPINVNGLGFPASVTANLSNLQLRVPTERDPAFGQNHLLTNLSGFPLSTSLNGTADLTSPTQDVVRAMRAGGASEDTADPSNGFLRDDDPPLLIGQQQAFIETPPVQDPGTPEVFTIGRLRFDSQTCARAPRPGDVIQQPFVFAEVLAASPLVGDLASNVRVRLLAFPDQPGWPGVWTGSALGGATVSGLYDPLAGVLDECFVRFSPAPTDPEAPDLAVPVDATMTLRFSEAMDPVSVDGFSSLVLSRAPEPTNSDDFVVGQVSCSPDLRSFTFVPNTRLFHVSGTREPYFLALARGPEGPRDLAGNRLEVAPEAFRFELEPDQPTIRTGGRVTRFSSPDEDEPFGTDETGLLPEWSGQHSYDLARGRIRPRPVSRFQTPVDRSQPIVSVMTPFAFGLQTPLTPFGSKMMHLYRYLDVGMDLRDSGNYNIDVEQMHWAPLDGFVTADRFPEYQIRMAHSNRAPDESTQGSTGCPRFPSSGLAPRFDNLILTPDVAPMKVVHPRERGYVIDPGEAFLTSSGTLVVPWPINRNPAFETVTFTWRDTGVIGRGGPNNGGVDPFSVSLIGLDRDTMYNTDNIQTVGLPLLVEHRCYPAVADAIGNNALDIILAPPMFRRPQFRAFSSGGFGPGGNIVTVDPDLEDRANGGFNPMSGGGRTPPTDPTIYLGAIDFVVRVSRSFSIWFATVDPLGGFFDSPEFDRPLVDPIPSDQPNGTRVDLAFRGALLIDDVLPEPEDPRFNATSLDFYGNHYDDLTGVLDAELANLPITFLTGREDWTELGAPGSPNPTGLDGSSYYQVRVSFFSNIQSGLGPTLSALAVSWE